MSEIILMMSDEMFIVRYDCSEHILGFLDYCVHFMSRTPTMEPAKVDTGTTFINL